ncbi:unnamed protein product [Pedinophyceae sp. YPF-701]|nr:unnamed protein product [Pedinophyceae sp. YPF-701]
MGCASSKPAREEKHTGGQQAAGKAGPVRPPPKQPHEEVDVLDKATNLVPLEHNHNPVHSSNNKTPEKSEGGLTPSASGRRPTGTGPEVVQAVEQVVSPTAASEMRDPTPQGGKEEPRAATPTRSAVAADIGFGEKLSAQAQKQALVELCQTCKEGDLLKIGKLLLKCPDPNEKDESGETPVHFAASGGHASVIKYLRESWGANVRLKNNRGETPLHAAAAHGSSHVEAARYLLKHGRADPNGRNRDGNAAMHLAAAADGDPLMMQYLVYQGAELEPRNKGQETPLHVAAFHGRVPLVKYLVEQGCRGDVGNEAGDTALHLAAREGHAEALSVLLASKGTNHSVANKAGDTPLAVAKSKGHASAAEILQKAGAN